MFPRNVPLDLTQFAADAPVKTRYGLPAKVEYCRKCVISNQRPASSVEFLNEKESRKATIRFDEQGVCDACRFSERKHNQIDWDSRDQELRELLARYRKGDGSYDVLVPGSGGKDSIYAAHVLKYKYGMNPLTVTWSPALHTPWGWNNFQNWLGSGFPNYLFTPNPLVHRLLTRLAVENLFHPFQSFILGQKNFAPKMAMRMNIPLVIYGENEAEYGNPISETDTAQRDLRYFALNDPQNAFLGGVSIADLTKEFGVTAADIASYLPADEDQLKAKEVQVHYLGYYLKWHPQGCYFYSVENAGFRAAPERTPGTYSKYNSIDDKIDDLHYYTTFIKFGLGRASYDAAQEIRSGDIDRDEGVALVRKYDGEYPARFETELMEYLSIPPALFPQASRHFEEPMMDRDYFSDLADRFRSPHLWQRSLGGWSLRQEMVSSIGKDT